MERYDLMRKLKQPKTAGWVMHASFKKKENAEYLKSSMEKDKPFQDYKIIEGGCEQSPHWMDDFIPMLQREHLNRNMGF